MTFAAGKEATLQDSMCATAKARSIRRAGFLHCGPTAESYEVRLLHFLQPQANFVFVFAGEVPLHEFALKVGGSVIV